MEETMDRINDAANALVEACQHEREVEVERHRSRMDEIQAAEEAALKIVDSAPQASPPQVPAGAETKAEAKEPPKAPSPPRSAPPAAKAPQRKSPQRVGLTDEQKARLEEERQAVITFVRENPGCSQAQIAERLKKDKERVRVIVNNLTRNRRLRGEGSTAARRYYHPQAPLSHETLPPDKEKKPEEAESSTEEVEEKKQEPPPAASNGRPRPGPKTDLERSVVDILKERPLTVGGLSVRLKLPEKKLNPVLSGLVVRGVCKRKPISSSAQPVFDLV